MCIRDSYYRGCRLMFRACL